MSPFAINWRDFQSVVEYAERLVRIGGFAQVVIRKAGRPNWNITFMERTDTYEPHEVYAVCMDGGVIFPPKTREDWLNINN